MARPRPFGHSGSGHPQVGTVKDSAKRAEAATAAAAKIGVKTTDFFWTMGAYDVVMLCEAPDDEAMTAFALSLASLGNVKSQTMRAYRSKEFKAILTRMK
jgi:uncharacterized protein with GYD domain